MLRHKVANGLCGVAETERERCRGALDGVFRRERLPFDKLCHDVANEKVRWRRSSQDGQGPRKVSSWRSNLSWSKPRS